MSNKFFYCDACSLNKIHKLPFGENSFKVSKPLELVYSDVWGQVKISNDGYQYYVIFVDFFSKYTWFYPIKRKSDVSTLFPIFKTLVEKFFQTPSSLFSRTMGENTSVSSLIFNKMVFTTLPPLHTLRNKTEWRNVDIDTLLKPGCQFCIMPTYHSCFGLMPFKRRFTLLTDYQPKF